LGLYRVDARTGAITPVLRDGVRWGIWTADGKSIIYVQEDERGGSIRIRNLDNGEYKELFRPGQSMYSSNLALSPDGRRLAFGLSTLSQIIGQILMVLPLDGGKPRELLRVTVLEGQFRGLDWARDGSHLLFARQGEMWRIPAEGGKPEALGLKPTGSDGFAVHPDGRRIAFIAGERKEEVWVMENFLPTQAAGR
ncbi:MAG: TolB family protein, partial [Terriglobia bacterium]